MGPVQLATEQSSSRLSASHFGYGSAPSYRSGRSAGSDISSHSKASLASKPSANISSSQTGASTNNPTTYLGDQTASAFASRRSLTSTDVGSRTDGTVAARSLLIGTGKPGNSAVESREPSIQLTWLPASLVFLPKAKIQNSHKGTSHDGRSAAGLTYESSCGGPGTFYETETGVSMSRVGGSTARGNRSLAVRKLGKKDVGLSIEPFQLVRQFLKEDTTSTILTHSSMQQKSSQGSVVMRQYGQLASAPW